VVYSKPGNDNLQEVTVPCSYSLLQTDVAEGDWGYLVCICVASKVSLS